ncbi:MAG TPA: AraC family transcriptional regulator [Mucilaginibacter sp.]|jgi:AraC family transcriptional regulator
MYLLGPGTYLGLNDITYPLQGGSLTVTRFAETTIPFCEPHAHSNPHITYLVAGGTREKRGTTFHERKAGDLVFFHSDEIHQNSHTPVNSVNINLEFDYHFLSGLRTSEHDLESLCRANNALVTFAMFQFYKELKISDSETELSVKSLTMLFGSGDLERSSSTQLPMWVYKVKEALHDNWDNPISLDELAQFASVHPVTISRYFPRFFSVNVGEYRRMLKIEHALPLLKSNRHSLTEIAYLCGFADQSHFTRTMKRLTGFLPETYQKF